MEENEGFENDVEFEDEETHGIGGKIAVGVGLLAVAGAAGAAIVAKKKGKLAELKAKRQEAKIEKLESKLEKEYVKIHEISDKKSEEEE